MGNKEREEERRSQRLCHIAKAMKERFNQGKEEDSWA